MAAPNTISIDKLVRLIGTPKCPVLVDVRGQNDFEADPHLIPSSTRYTSNKLEDRAEGYGGKSAIVMSRKWSERGDLNSRPPVPYVGNYCFSCPFRFPSGASRPWI